MSLFPFLSQTLAALSGMPRLLPTHAAFTALQVPPCRANYLQSNLAETRGEEQTNTRGFVEQIRPSEMGATAADFCPTLASPHAVILDTKYCFSVFFKVH